MKKQKIRSNIKIGKTFFNAIRKATLATGGLATLVSPTAIYSQDISSISNKIKEIENYFKGKNGNIGNYFIEFGEDNKGSYIYLDYRDCCNQIIYLDHKKDGLNNNDFIKSINYEDNESSIKYVYEDIEGNFWVDVKGKSYSGEEAKKIISEMQKEEKFHLEKILELIHQSK